MDFYQELGPLIFGTRLKRISDRFLADIAKIYQSLEIPFEPSWFPMFYLLHKNEEMAVTEISGRTGVTHSAVSQLISSLEQKQLIECRKDGNDGRRRLVCLSSSGKALLRQVLPVWTALDKAMFALLDEKNNSATLLKGLDEFEGAVADRPVFDRVMEILNQS